MKHFTLWAPCALAAALIANVGSPVGYAQSIAQLQPVHVIEVPGLAEDSPHPRAPVITAVAMNPAGSFLAAAGDDHVVRLWSWPDGQLKAELHGHTDWVRTLRFSSDGTYLASAGDDRQILLWNPETGRIVRRLPRHPEAIFAIDFEPHGGQLAVVGFEDRLRMYAYDTGQPTAILECSSRDTRTVSFSPDGQRVAAAGRDGRVRMWNVADRTMYREWPADQRRIRAIAFTPDGSRLATGGDGHRLCVWDVATGDAVMALNVRPGKVHSLTFVGPERLAAGTSDNLIRVFDVSQGGEMHQLVGHTGSVAVLDYNRTLDLLVSGAFDTTVRMWTVDGGKKKLDTARLGEGSKPR